MMINEMFISVDGEVNKWGQGGFTCFIRTAGCNLQCDYCDTEYAQSTKAGKKYSITKIIAAIPPGISKVTITGGEPFLQKGMGKLIDALLTQYYRVSVETNGTIIPDFPGGASRNCSIVMDYKLQCTDKMVVPWHLLTKDDYIKIVIGSVEDYIQAKQLISENKTDANIYLAPIYGKVDPRDLIENLKKDRLYHIGINLQLHKVIYQEEKESINLLK